MNVAAMLQLIPHLFKHGCKQCGEKPLPHTFRHFSTKVTLTADGEIDTIEHQCRRCRVQEN